MFRIGPENDATQTGGELEANPDLSAMTLDLTARKQASITSRMSTTTSSCHSQEQATESRLVSHQKQAAGEVDNRCLEIIDAFGLHPLEVREVYSLRG
jgi:putative heme iron utilization protein